MGETKLILDNKKATKVPKSFRDELSLLDLDWTKLKSVLPDWTELAFENQAGILELKMFLARNIGLKVLESGHLARKPLPPVRFKTTKGTTHEQVTTARGLVTACARLISKATLPEWKGIPSDPAEFRKAVLAHSKQKWADLPAVLATCWSYGIPVLYIPDLPVRGKKMEGMVTFVAGHPIIILTKKAPHPDWMLFLLCHEIGHIAHKHLPMIDGECIIDEKIDVENTGNDAEEAEANFYAGHILAEGGQQVKLGRLTKASTFASIANTHALANGMSPGYVVLNACHNTISPDGKKPFALAQKALAHLPDYLSGKSTEDIFNEATRAHIDIDMLNDDSLELLEKLGVL